MPSLFLRAVVTAASTACAPSLFAQQAEQRPPQAVSRTVPSVAPVGGPILIETSAPILNLFTRAEDGIAREDWKFAIDSLQRIIEDPEGALVPWFEGGTDVDGLFESARRLATRNIATLPPAGLEAYRILYDGRAKALFERARADHDTAGLRTVVDRYQLTQYGDDAADLLASWCLDEGRPAEALAVLMDMRELAEDSDVPAALILGKLAAANAMLGQRDQVDAVLEEGPAGRSEWADELRALAPRPDRGAAEASWWPQLYRVMPASEPSLSALKLEYRMPGSAAGWWSWIHDDAPDAPLVLPAGRLASDGRDIYVRRPGGCAALDRDDLTVLWESTDPRAPRTPSVARPAAQPGTARSATEGAVEDYIAESITAAHGLVLLVERGLAPVRTGPNLFVAPGRQAQPSRTDLATRLIAYDARSGRLRWHSGTIDDPEGALSGALFRWSPIAVGAELWVPYSRQTDFHVAVLDPGRGAVIKTILLGSVTQPIDSFGPAAPPTYADGIVFIPSGFGTLFAVDGQHRTVRWARQYDQIRARTPTMLSAAAWLTGEPLVAGGLVILPPEEHRGLLALWAASGRTRWTVAVDGGAYPIAADAKHLWIGGRGISCLALATGEVLWRTYLIATPTGRAAVCGDLIYVPTAAGLLSLDARSGESVGIEPAAASDTPLGNLLCTSTALYSLDPTSVRAFPDVERTYAIAQARFDPMEPASVARMAWAELIRDAPQEAWALLERIPSRTIAEDPPLAAAISRIGVEALMRIARRETAGSARALAWLRRAESVAAGAADRIRCRLEMAEQQIVAGRHEEAYRELTALGWSDDGDRIVRVADSVDAPARTEATRRLIALEGRLDSDLRARMKTEAMEQVDRASRALEAPGESRAARWRLRALAEVHAATGAGQRALLELAERESERSAFESAELLLRECVSRPADPLLTTAGWVELCALYDRSGLDWPAALHPCLMELEARFGAVTFDGVGDVGSRITRGQRVADWVAQVRSSAPAGATPGPRADHPTDTIVLMNEPAWTRGTTEGNPATNFGRVVDFGEASQAALQDRLVVLRQDGLIECLNLIDGEPLWETQLRNAGDFLDPATVQNQPEGPRRAVADGQVAVFHHFDGLYAVGLLTGRRLWVRPLEVVQEPARTYLRDGAMAAGDGLLAAMPRDGWLTLMRLTDGSTVWERDLRGEPVDRIWMHGDRILTLDGSGERLHILNRADGELVKQVLFEQPNRGSPAIPLVRTGGMVIGPDLSAGSNTVFAVDMRTGEQAWRMEPELPVLHLFEPQEGFVGLGVGQGSAQVVDAASGEIVLERQVPTGRAVLGGALVDGTLVLRADGLRQQKQVVELFAFDVATGEPVWHRDDVGGLASAEKVLPLEQGLIAALTDSVKTDISGTGAATRGNRTVLTLINAKTGQDAGASVEVTTMITGQRSAVDVFVRGGVVVMGSNRGLHAFRTKAVPRADVGGNF